VSGVNGSVTSVTVTQCQRFGVQGSGLGDWAWGGWVSELPKSVKKEVQGLGCFG